MQIIPNEDVTKAPHSVIGTASEIREFVKRGDEERTIMDAIDEEEDAQLTHEKRVEEAEQADRSYLEDNHNQE